MPLQSQSPAGILVQPQSYTAPGPLHTPHVSNEPTHESTSSHTPSVSVSNAHEPPHTLRASNTLPLQSQSPAGILVQPQLYTAPGPLHTLQASNVPTHESTSSHTPSSSTSTAHSAFWHALVSVEFTNSNPPAVVITIPVNPVGIPDKPLNWVSIPEPGCISVFVNENPNAL